jgi:hypothetical protein
MLLELWVNANRAANEAERAAQERQTRRTRITDPIERANFDRSGNQLDLALEDLAAVNPGSTEYDMAQKLKASIAREIESRKPPKTEVAEANCRAAVKDAEKFPSTVGYRWLGTESTVDREAMQITVTVDYTAKNSMGAELPYRMTCIATYDGNVLNSDIRGR